MYALYIAFAGDDILETEQFGGAESVFYREESYKERLEELIVGNPTLAELRQDWDFGEIVLEWLKSNPIYEDEDTGVIYEVEDLIRGYIREETDRHSEELNGYLESICDEQQDISKYLEDLRNGVRVSVELNFV